MRTGLVRKNTGSWYLVEDFTDGRLYPCRIRGKFRLQGIRTTNPVSVGDRVDFEVESSGAGVITAVQERRNYIIRRASNLSKEAHIIAANVDHVFLVVTLDFPITSYEFIDRFLVTCEAYRVPAVIVLNKIDLFDDPAFRPLIRDFKEIYASAGYEVVEASAVDGTGIDVLHEKMAGAVSLFSGNSGVGKSTLIQALAPEIDVRIGEISEYHNRGKHTTTFSEMYKIGADTYLIDTPGIKGFGLIDLEREEIARYFPDLFRLAPKCQYYNCTHTHEPGCAVKGAVEQGEVSAERYNSYLKMMDEHEDGKYRR